MATALRHRGPDARGTWVDQARTIGLAHTRLSIQDTSPAGAQPMISPSGRFVLTFNGEIYNHLQLRHQLLPQASWKGHSDTETLLHCFELLGVQRTLAATRGMFALGIWDSDTGTLTLARDRIGEKPLYWAMGAGHVVFASELKALRRSGLGHEQIDPLALAAFLQQGHVPGGLSIYQSVTKVAPGSLVQFKMAAGRLQADEHRYWSLDEQVRPANGHTYPVGDAVWMDRLDATLRQAIQLQTLSDVPVGTFLSGGIDSTVVTALMQAGSPHPVKTFTIGFDEAEYDESAHARAVARHLGTDHTELIVSATMAQEVIPRLPAIYDEPFADASQIPTALLCELARTQVVVALSGDGADELFGGYSRHFLADPLWHRIRHVPHAMRVALSSAAQGMQSHHWHSLAAMAQRWLPRHARFSEGFAKLQKLSRMIGARTPDDLYILATRAALPSANLLRASVQPAPSLEVAPSFSCLAERFMYMDTLQYLPDDVLVKVDRAAMHCALETRAPFLDPQVIALAWQMPSHLKVHQRQGKQALRQVLARYVPPDLTARPKQGFAVPIGQWIRGPLRAWGEALLDTSRLARHGLLDARQVSALWNEHVRGDADHHQLLWHLLMFQAWFEEHHA